MNGKCFNCGAIWKDITRKPGRNEYCDNCNAVWHCCKNCNFFDNTAPNHCRSMTTEKVADIEKPNFCDEFLLADNYTKSKTAEPKQDAKKKFGDLFKI